MIEDVGGVDLAVVEAVEAAVQREHSNAEASSASACCISDHELQRTVYTRVYGLQYEHCSCDR